MKQNENTTEQNESVTITEKDFQEFLSATGDARWKILLPTPKKIEKLFK